LGDICTLRSTPLRGVRVGAEGGGVLFPVDVNLVLQGNIGFHPSPNTTIKCLVIQRNLFVGFGGGAAGVGVLFPVDVNLVLQ
jgi:hypothetical protein